MFIEKAVATERRRQAAQVRKDRYRTNNITCLYCIAFHWRALLHSFKMSFEEFSSWFHNEIMPKQREIDESNTTQRTQKPEVSMGIDHIIARRERLRSQYL